jgi:hypothetical protein
MNRRIRGMHPRLGLTSLGALLITVVGILSLAAYGQTLSSGSGTTSASDLLLPRDVIVPISVVNRFFPEVTRELSTGKNLTAVKKAKATRSVIYANSDSSTKVTITVDQYADSSDASSAYDEAVQKSRIVPGFKSLSARNLSPHAFIGTVTQDGETHIGAGAVDGTLIVGATLAGYQATPANIDNLIKLTRTEQQNANTTLDTSISPAATDKVDAVVEN